MLHEVPYKIMNSELVNSEWVHSINTYWTFIKMSDQMCRVRTQNVSHIWFKGQFRNFLAWGCCAAWKRLYIYIYALERIGLICSPPFGLIGYLWLVLKFCWNCTMISIVFAKWTTFIQTSGFTSYSVNHTKKDP
jgi:hypothetical protein